MTRDNGGPVRTEAQGRLARFVESAQALTGLTAEQILDVISHWYWGMYPWDEVDQWWVDELRRDFPVSADALESLMFLRDRLDGTTPMPSVEQTLGVNADAMLQARGEEK